MAAEQGELTGEALLHASYAPPSMHGPPLGCDPCLSPPLGPQEIATLGGDVLDVNAAAA